MLRIKCAIPRQPWQRAALSTILVASLPACSAMQGVNVGANIPLGGLVNVGVNTTINDQKPSPPPQQPADDPQDESEATD
jgi:hypothetical protein